MGRKKKCPEGNVADTNAPKEVMEEKVELISYSMKMVIPTGQYANIQPEIIVKATSVEGAEKFLAPHFQKLWKDYFMCTERRPVQTPVNNVAVPAPQVQDSNPVSTVAFIKATQAIESALSIDALEMISDRIANSIKLTEEEKFELTPKWMNRLKELTPKEDVKETIVAEATPVVEPDVVLDEQQDEVS